MSGSLIKRTGFWTLLAVLLPLLILILSLAVGSYRIPPKDLVHTVAGLISPSRHPDVPPAFKDILLHIRLPRLLLALMVGAALSLSGAALQALFKNPLVNEYILGISSGAGFGAALSLVFLGRGFPPQVAAFGFALLAVFAVLTIAGRSESSVVPLLLTGVVVSAFFQALLALVVYFASPYALQTLFFWLMGNLALATWRDVLLAGPVMLAAAGVLILLRWRLNVLSMSETEARSLGVHVRREKILVILVATLATAAATSVAGIIGWIGLIGPHLVRMAVGAENRRVIPLSAAFGACFLMLADDVARMAVSFEIPVGIFTSILGIPVFVYLLAKAKKVWL
jgi:iron complex transport system permease protein